MGTSTNTSANVAHIYSQNRLITAMKRGTKVLKLGRVGKPHYCFFHLAPSEDCLEWYNEKKRNVKKVVMLRDVLEMRVGQASHETALFRYTNHFYMRTS